MRRRHALIVSGIAAMNVILFSALVDRNPVMAFLALILWALFLLLS